jgi:hypothetical protein
MEVGGQLHAQSVIVSNTLRLQYRDEQVDGICLLSALEETNALEGKIFFKLGQLIRCFIRLNAISGSYTEHFPFCEDPNFTVIIVRC